jgi:hypothetical protein
VFRNLGNTIMIDGEIVAGNGGVGSVGDTSFLNFSQPEIHQFIIDNSTVPEPGSLGILVIAGGAFALRRGRSKGTRISTSPLIPQRDAPRRAIPKTNLRLPPSTCATILA